MYCIDEAGGSLLEHENDGVSFCKLSTEQTLKTCFTSQHCMYYALNEAGILGFL